MDAGNESHIHIRVALSIDMLIVCTVIFDNQHLCVSSALLNNYYRSLTWHLFYFEQWFYLGKALFSLLP